MADLPKNLVDVSLHQENEKYKTKKDISYLIFTCFLIKFLLLLVVKLWCKSTTIFLFNKIFPKIFS